MYFKFFPLSIAVLTFFSAMMVSCSDAEIGTSDVPKLTQGIYVIPENYYNEPYMQYAPSDEFYINVNEKIKICGVYSINDEPIPIDLSSPYFQSHRWVIDSRESTASLVYYSFSKPGAYKVYFETIDNLGDTLISRATIYVNTPTTVSLQSPTNGFNQVNGENPDGLILSWNIFGIDPWETTTCYLYASYLRYQLWRTPLGEIDCDNSANLVGRLNLDINERNEIVQHDINNSTIYWGIQVITRNTKGNIEQTFSEVFNFSTKLENDGDAIIQIPISCMFSQYPEESYLTGAILSAAGDTLSRISGINGNTVILRELPPQSNVKISVCDSIRTDYGCSSMTFDIAPSTKTITDTLFLIDKTKPNMMPVTTEVASEELLQFLVLDNGSGVNASRITTLINKDTVPTYYEDNILYIKNACRKDCELHIYVEDYAHNKAPEVFWRLKAENEITSITGPFSKKEGDK